MKKSNKNIANFLDKLDTLMLELLPGQFYYDEDERIKILSHFNSVLKKWYKENNNA